MTLKLKISSNELWKGWNLAWYHHLTHITCLHKLRGFKPKLDALRVQNGPSPSSMRVSDEKSSVAKAFHFFSYFNCRLLVHSICTIQSHILKFQPFLTSFAIFHAFNIFFCVEWPWNWKAVQINSEKVETWHGIIISPR